MGEAWSGDSLNRKEAAGFLYDYIVSNEHIRVVNLNSPWGTGKTFFLDNWREDLARRHICISFNAWENDFSVEPLVSLVSEVNKQLSKYLSASGVREKLSSLISKTGLAIKSASPVIAKGLLLKFAGINADEVSDAVQVGAEASEQALKSLLDNQESVEKTIFEFKAALSESIERCKSENEGLGGKTFFIIDELDRCRPTYAIELLERVKHFFDIEGCVFIIASDTEQLSHAVRSVYGEGFDSSRYLKRFFDAEFSLDNSDIYGFVSIKSEPLVGLMVDLDLSLRPSFLGLANHDSNTLFVGDQGNKEALFLTALAKQFGTSLREVDKNIKQIISIKNHRPLDFDFVYASILVFMKDAIPDGYKALMGGVGYLPDPERVFGNLESKTPVSIIVEKTKVSPIELFLIYYRALAAKRDELQKRIGSGQGLAMAVAYIILNKKSALENLPKVVNLASALR